MNRAELKKYIEETYLADSDFPWIENNTYEVFRHPNNRKWFALVMDISKQRLGMPETGEISIVNLKCDPILIGSLLGNTGFFPAYHMSKTNWITVALDGSAPDEEIKMLLDMSFTATAVKLKKRRLQRTHEAGVENS